MKWTEAAHALQFAVERLVQQPVVIERHVAKDALQLRCGTWALELSREWLESSDRDMLAQLASKITVQIERARRAEERDMQYHNFMQQRNNMLGNIGGMLGMGSGLTGSTAVPSAGGYYYYSQPGDAQNVGWPLHQQLEAYKQQLQQQLAPNRVEPPPKPLTNRQWLEQRVNEVRVRLPRT